MAKKKTEELENLQEKVEELEAQLKRAVADYRNLEARVSEGRSELTAFVGAELIRKLLPVLDHLDQAVRGARESGVSNPWLDGVTMTVKQFRQVLSENGVEVMPIEPGDEFDHNIHEAVDMRPLTDEEAMEKNAINDIILDVVENGYTLNGKLFRPAKVVIGRRRNKVSNLAE